jgi:OOP family OmpA-OmpF porin
MNLVSKKAIFLVFGATAIFTASFQAHALDPTKDKVLLRLKVEDSDEKPVAGTVISVKNDRQETIFSNVTDEKGFFELLVPNGKSYFVKFISLADPNAETAKQIDVPDKPNFKFTLLLVYNPVFVSTFVLGGVYFDTGKAKLKPESHANLQDLLEYMKAKKTTVIELSGHTDDAGDDQANLKLSEDRAKAVKQYLVDKGVLADRINAVGYGETRPIASNKTTEGRRQNRRTEVKILKQ